MGICSLYEQTSIYLQNTTHKGFRVEIYYCISLQIQIIVSASWAETIHPGGYFYSGCSPTHNGQGYSQLGRNYRRLVDIFIIKYIQV